MNIYKYLILKEETADFFVGFKYLVSGFSLNFRDISCWVVELNAAFCLPEWA